VGGCTNCKSKPGCDDRKGQMFEALDHAIDRLYPTRTWGQPDDLARFETGICEHDAQALSDELAAELDAATFFKPGGEDEYCDYIYVLCIGREPCLVQVRDGGVSLPDELANEPIHEQYLRICLSSMARFARVQQVSMALSWEDGQPLVTEAPRPGVYDAPLLKRMQKLVATLPAYDIVHLDFGEICAPVPGFESGDYAELFGGEPLKANYIFYPQPPTMREASLLRAWATAVN